MSLILLNTDVKKACRLARQLELKGEYACAAERLHHFWRGVGERPNTEGLSAEDAAQLLLQAGSLTGWLGAARQIAGAQSTARDLISEAARTFSDSDSILECKNELAVCYWREGDLEAATAVAREAFGRSRSGTSQRLFLVNTLVSLEIQQGRLKGAGELLSSHADEAKTIDVPFARAAFHSHLGFVCKRRGEESADEDERADLLDVALIQYEGACAFFEEMGHARNVARTKNNIAMVFIVRGSPELAHPYIQEAIGIAKTFKDESMLGSFEDTRARAFLLEGKLREALVAASTSLTYLRDGEELALQAESHTTRGIILARMGDEYEAEKSFSRAVEAAETAQIPTAEIRLARLREMMEMHKSEALRFEREWVQLALDVSGGHPSIAAKLIGVSHQNFINKIRRFNLETERAPIHPRRRKA